MSNEHVAEPFRSIVNAFSGQKSESEVVLLDSLTYLSYAHNRKLSPEITPEQWARIFGPTEAMEERFQKEKELVANARHAQ